ncbi:MAG: hypothetical protein JSW16_02355 [Dehalococcoidales bacterium]|nr:MAG: hypothetical protein JSW16_02355 [Dehalococcoidales bacterium]
MFRKLLIITLIGASMFVWGCSAGTAENGILHGKVAIGPISPVEQPGVDNEIPCEVYQARKIMVYDRKHQNLVKQVDIDCDGRYRTELKPGIYVVDINRIGIDNSPEVPAEIRIESGLTTRLDIDIDTGIR